MPVFKSFMRKFESKTQQVEKSEDTVYDSQFAQCEQLATLLRDTLKRIKATRVEMSRQLTADKESTEALKTFYEAHPSRMTRAVQKLHHATAYVAEDRTTWMEKQFNDHVEGPLLEYLRAVDATFGLCKDREQRRQEYDHYRFKVRKLKKDGGFDAKAQEKLARNETKLTESKQKFEEATMEAKKQMTDHWARRFEVIDAAFCNLVSVQIEVADACALEMVSLNPFVEVLARRLPHCQSALSLSATTLPQSTGVDAFAVHKEEARERHQNKVSKWFHNKRNKSQTDEELPAESDVTATTTTTFTPTAPLRPPPAPMTSTTTSTATGSVTTTTYAFSKPTPPPAPSRSPYAPTPPTAPQRAPFAPRPPPAPPAPARGVPTQPAGIDYGMDDMPAQPTRPLQPRPPPRPPVSQPRSTQSDNPFLID
ncbi:MAG: hypothetical protein MHM6MM_001988 [Cercozoa sp. M6MM]